MLRGKDGNMVLENRVKILVWKEYIEELYKTRTKSTEPQKWKMEIMTLQDLPSWWMKSNQQ